jgi:hypothetical protein
MAKWLAYWSQVLSNAGGANIPCGRERDGSLYRRDYWVDIGLSKEVVAALKRQAHRYGIKERPSAAMARQLICMALLSLPLLEKQWNATMDYCEAEGIKHPHDFIDSRIAATV